MAVYLDHNASTAIDPRVLARYVEIESECAGNPASPHRSGRRARAIVEDARAAVAAALGVLADEVVFVSGGTEANNMAVAGSGDPSLPVLASAAEHPSVLAPAERRGLAELRVDAEGRVCLTPPAIAVGLLCITHGQSEVGTLQPVGAARRLADALGVPLHVDASQTLGRVDLAEAVGAADTLTLSPHKAGGPKGIGVLIARRQGVRPLLLGGSQERGLRAGTVSPALAGAVARAIELAVEEWRDRAHAMLRARDAFESGLAVLRGVRRLTPATALPNTVMLCFTAVRDGRVLLPALDLAGVEASHGSACSSGSPQPPRVLQAMGLDEEAARRAVRFSFSHRTTIDAAQEASRIVVDVAQRLARA